MNFQVLQATPHMVRLIPSAQGHGPLKIWERAFSSVIPLQVIVWTRSRRARCARPMHDVHGSTVSSANAYGIEAPNNSPVNAHKWRMSAPVAPARTQKTPNSERLTDALEPIATPFPINAVAFPTASKTPVHPRNHSSSCGHWNRASNSRCWSHILDNINGMCARDRGCGLHIFCNGSGLYALNDNWRNFQYGCCYEYG